MGTTNDDDLSEYFRGSRRRTPNSFSMEIETERDLEETLPWNRETCFIVIHYVSKCISDYHCYSDDDGKLSGIIKGLSDLASLHQYTRNPRPHNHKGLSMNVKMFCSSDSYLMKVGRLEQEIGAMYVNSFMPEALRFFHAPKKASLSLLFKKNEILAAFIDFLLQILHSEAHYDYNDLLRKELKFRLSSNQEQQQISYGFYALLNQGQQIRYDYDDALLRKESKFLLSSNQEQQIRYDYDALLRKKLTFLNQEQQIRYDYDTLLRKELTFLLTVLGDTPFQCTTSSSQIATEQVDNILAEFEIFANQVGDFISSCVFATPPVLDTTRFIDYLATLLELVVPLNEKIKHHCTKFSELMINHPTCINATTTYTPAIDSLFIVDSLLEDLHNLMNGLFRVPLDDITGDLVKAIHEEMTLAQTVLKDLDSYKDELLKESLVHIRDVAYEAEYLVNSYVVGNLPIWYLNLRLPTVIQKIKQIRVRLQDIDKIINKDDVKIDQVFDKKLSFRAIETRVDDDNILVGFEDEQIEILDDLIGGSESRQIISIFGLPGLGKTTMAMKMYNHRASCDYFDERAWCVVSQTYEKRSVLAGILMSLAANKMEKQEKERIAKVIIKKEEESIVEMEARLSLEIYRRLNRQRYLIVVDDVWDSDTIYDLCRYFPDDGNGSRVILTSRIKDTAPTGSIFHQLHLLSEGQCWDLLQKKVFFGEPCPSKLSCIGQAIAAKCHGLPLTVVVVGGFLAKLEKEENMWRKVETNLDSYIFDDQSGCLKILELSYEYLPNHLKLCFLYFGAFPEDEEIRTRKLVWLWIAEGFIPKQEEDSQETIAEQYLLELINRSLVMVVKRKSLGGVKTCGLHDLLHDMCRRKAHDENFLKYVKEEYSLYERHQRLYVHSDSSQLRRFGLCFRSLSCSSSEPLVGLWHMPLLRVIDMMKERSKNSNEIYHLVYLRYFAVFYLPKPIVNNLVNLEVLYIESDEIMLSVILKMRKLRHLHSNGGTTIGKDCDTSHSQTTSLKSLGHVIIDNHEYGEILRCSPCLRKLNCSFGGTIFPDLHSLTELESLNMSYQDLRCEEITEIWFPSTIKKLTLSEFCLTSEVISIIGRLPNLQCLKLSEDFDEEEALKEEEWVTNDGEFQELRFLILEWVYLTRWSTCNEYFPKLECLKLNNCKQLEEIPGELGNIPTLQTVEVNYSSYKASLSAVQMEIEQSESYGNEGLVVTINGWSKEQLVRDCNQTS